MLCVFILFASLHGRVLREEHHVTSLVDASGQISLPNTAKSRRAHAVAHNGWTQWSECSKPCGDGFQIRTRRVRRPVKASNKSSEQQEVGDSEVQLPEASKNMPNETEFRVCNEGACCGTWSNWSLCSVTCGGGKKTRERKCNDTDAGPRDWQECGQTPCPTCSSNYECTDIRKSRCEINTGSCIPCTATTDCHHIGRQMECRDSKCEEKITTTTTTTTTEAPTGIQVEYWHLGAAGGAVLILLLITYYGASRRSVPAVPLAAQMEESESDYEEPAPTKPHTRKGRR